MEHRTGAIDPSRHLAAAQQRIALSSTMEVGWALGHVGDVPIAEWANTTLSQPFHYQLIFPIDTVAVRPATRRRSGGTLSSLMRTGMRCARRTQLKVGLTNANRSLLVLRFWSSIP